jgi:transcriptional regulator GlxA family with amidase domain
MFQKTQNHSLKFISLLEDMIQLNHNREIVYQCIDDAVNYVSNLRKNEISDKRIRKAMLFMEENYCKSLKISDVSKEVAMTEKALMRLFYQKTNQTMNDFLSEIRILEAKKLLRDTEESIEEIAYRCGYGNYRSFDKAFKRKTGVSPGEYRKNC